jgi:LacI family transcriptional regulator
MLSRAQALRRFSLPCGVFTATDQTAARVVDAALDQGLRVPDDLAILGVDDDPIRCAMSRVELSSVRPNSAAQGYQAMNLVRELLTATRKPRKPILRLIAPLGVTARRSTDTYAHPDPQVVSVLRTVRDQIREVRGVDDLARTCGLGVRTLERLFHGHLQTTPREALNRARFDFARSLLIQTQLGIGEIADRAGYADVRTLIWQCKRRSGQTPLALRKSLSGT